jgi:acetoin utilization deacetylase AcuC-like enzyme
MARKRSSTGATTCSRSRCTRKTAFRPATAARDRGEGAGLGCNLSIPLCWPAAKAFAPVAFERLVTPAIERYRPELIVVACGFDANGVDRWRACSCPHKPFAA